MTKRKRPKTIYKKSAIAVDDWKVDIFLPILKEAGFKDLQVGAGVTNDSRIITVKFDVRQFRKLAETVQKCQVKAAEAKG